MSASPSPSHSPALAASQEGDSGQPVSPAPSAEADVAMSISQELAPNQPQEQQQQQQSQPDAASRPPPPAAAPAGLASAPGGAAPRSRSSSSAGLPSPAGSAAAAAAAAAASASLAAPAPSPPVRPLSPVHVLAPLELPAMRELPPIKLGKTAKERQLYEHLGDLYSLLVTTEHLETAYVRDAISEQAYTHACARLIAQYKTLREAMGDTAPELDAFCREYSLECRAAEQRFKVGIPATVVHGEAGGAGGSFGGGGGGGGMGGSDRRMEVSVFHAVQNFITLMDSLKLGQRAVDELHPPLVELVDSISRVPSLPQDHESRQKTMSWLTTLHQMKAHQELNDEQTRQMAFDLDSAYNAFHKFVKGH